MSLFKQILFCFLNLIALNISGMHDQSEKTNFVAFSVKQRADIKSCQRLLACYIHLGAKTCDKVQTLNSSFFFEGGNDKGSEDSMSKQLLLCSFSYGSDVNIYHFSGLLTIEGTRPDTVGTFALHYSVDRLDLSQRNLWKSWKNNDL